MASDTPVLAMRGIPAHGRIPRALLRDASISRDARLLWAELEDHVGKDGEAPWPAQETMAEHLGCTDRAVRNWLNELVRAGWLSVEARPGRSNKYWLNWVPVSTAWNTGSGVAPRNPRSTPPRNARSGGSGTAVPPNKNQEQEPFEEPPPTPSVGGGDGSPSLFPVASAAPPAASSADAAIDRFFDERFWPAYPSGRRQGEVASGGGRGSQSQARKAFRRAVHRGHAPAELLARLLNYLRGREIAAEAWGAQAPLMGATRFLNTDHLDWAEQPGGPDDERVLRWEMPCRRAAGAGSAAPGPQEAFRLGLAAYMASRAVAGNADDRRAAFQAELAKLHPCVGQAARATSAAFGGNDRAAYQVFAGHYQVALSAAGLGAVA